MATWTEDIVDALVHLGGTGSYSAIYAEIRKMRETLPESWQFIVQREIQRHSRQSSGWEGRRDLFFSVEGLGRGIWGLNELVADTPLAADLPGPVEAAPQADLAHGNEQPAHAQQVTYRVLRDTKLARQLKLLHRDRCQLCGLALKFPDGITYSEAHHIIPLGTKHNGPDVAGNIIVLCPNHHALCDAGAIPLVIENIRTAEGHSLSEDSLRYHQQEILRAI